MSGTGPVGPGGERRRVDPLTGLPLDPAAGDERPTTALPRPGTEPTSWIPRPPSGPPQPPGPAQPLPSSGPVPSPAPGPRPRGPAGPPAYRGEAERQAEPAGYEPWEQDRPYRQPPGSQQRSARAEEPYRQDPYRGAEPGPTRRRSGPDRDSAGRTRPDYRRPEYAGGDYPGYPDSDYPHADPRDSRYPDPGYPGADYRGPAPADDQGAGYRDPGYRQSGRQRPSYGAGPHPEPAYGYEDDYGTGRGRPRPYQPYQQGPGRRPPEPDYDDRPGYGYPPPRPESDYYDRPIGGRGTDYRGREGGGRRGEAYADEEYPALEAPRLRPPDAPLTPRRSYPSAEYPDLTKQRQPDPRRSHLPPYQGPVTDPDVEPGEAPPDAKAGRPTDPTAAVGGRSPRKLTVTRVAALRSRELTSRGVKLFYKATTADGADVSGLAHLTYAVMGNYAVDAALMVALANTIFFADTGSTGKVLLYLLITVAPFAVVAPLIGPMLDKMQRGRRLALALSSFGRALLTLIMVFNMTPFNGWVIYPCALGNLVLSKAFSVLKAALTPRVLPEQITLVKTNSRLTVFGLLAGGVAGAIAAGLLKLFDAPGALIFTTACGIFGGVLCLRIPSWVESTEGEVPVKHVTGQYGRRGFPVPVRITLWTNSMIRVETGFLALFMAFVVKNQFPNPPHSAFTQLLLLGIIGGAAGLGGFVGNALGARLNLANPEMIALICLVSTVVACLLAIVLPGMTTAALVGLVGSTSSSLAKVCLDSTIQHGLPEVSRASAFGKTESVLQLAWVFGGVVGLLIGGVWFGHRPGVYSIGFGAVGVLLALGLAQVLLERAGKSLLPQLTPGRSRRQQKPLGATAPAAAFPPRPGVNPDPSTATALPPTRRAPIRADGKTPKKPRKAGTDR